jgi:hypothetical protein
MEQMNSFLASVIGEGEPASRFGWCTAGKQIAIAIGLEAGWTRGKFPAEN